MPHDKRINAVPVPFFWSLVSLSYFHFYFIPGKNSPRPVPKGWVSEWVGGWNVCERVARASLLLREGASSKIYRILSPAIPTPVICPRGGGWRRRPNRAPPILHTARFMGGEILYASKCFFPLRERIWHRGNDTRADGGGFWPVDLHGVLELKWSPVFRALTFVSIFADFWCCITVCFIGVIVLLSLLLFLWSSFGRSSVCSRVVYCIFPVKRWCLFWFLWFLCRLAFVCNYRCSPFCVNFSLLCRFSLQR